MTGRSVGGPAGACATVLALLLAGCASVPTLDQAIQPSATQVPPAVEQAQGERVRAEVAERLLAARVAGDVALVDRAATGPAAGSERLRVRLDGALPDAAVATPLPATVLLSPQVEGWPRWFATVDATEPSAVEPSAAEPSGGPAEPSADASGPVVPPAGGELPVVEVYTADDVRTPYRLWGRLTMLPGAELPPFAAASVGAPARGGPSGPASAPSVAPDAAATGEPAEELLAVLDGLAAGYASVMTDGDSSESAARFEPDPFVDAVRDRAQAESDAVAEVANTTVEHQPSRGAPLFAAESSTGDILVVTAVTTMTVMTPRPGEGVLRPGPEVRAAAGIDETDGTLTTRSVAALAFVVPAEQGAIRLVAVGEGLVTAEAP